MAATRRGNHEGSRPVQRKDGRWQIGLFYLDAATGAQKRTTVTGKTAKQVRAKAKELRQRLDEGKPPRDSSVKLGAFARTWIDSTLAASDRKPSTQAWYRNMLEQHVIDSDIGRMPLDRIAPSSVDRWVVGMRNKGLADSTVRGAFLALRAVLSAAVRDEALATSPVKRKSPRIEDQREAAYLTPTQVHALLAAAEGSRYHPLLVLLVNTGLRRGEALALRWEHMPSKTELESGSAHIVVRGTLSRLDGVLQVTSPKTKQSRGRVIPLTPDAANVLLQLRQRTRTERLAAGSKWVDSGFVFTTELGEPCDPRNALRAVKAAVAKHNKSHSELSLPAGVGLHTLRHSAASTMIANGVPLKIVSAILGHSSIQITADVYGHVAPEVAHEAMATLAAALGGHRAAN